jgi:glycosyltransferase involved in cell wall biosynthesis
MSRASDSITPVLLTFNEEPNPAATLGFLRWARRVIVVDSGSTDRTEQIARAFSNVSWHTRTFDSFGEQWKFALVETGISTEYALALDADMQVTSRFLGELERTFLPNHFDGGIVPFEYSIGPRRLISSLYPSQLRVFRPDRVTAGTIGHAHSFEVNGRVYRFHNQIIHDDRKSLDRWAAAQISYSRLEYSRIRSIAHPALKDRLRALAGCGKTGFSPQ